MHGPSMAPPDEPFFLDVPRSAAIALPRAAWSRESCAKTGPLALTGDEPTGNHGGKGKRNGQLRSINRPPARTAAANQARQGRPPCLLEPGYPVEPEIRPNVTGRKDLTRQVLYSCGLNSTHSKRIDYSPKRRRKASEPRRALIVVGHVAGMGCPDLVEGFVEVDLLDRREPPETSPGFGLLEGLQEEVLDPL